MSELISGKEALIALANGEEVGVQALGDMNWYDSTHLTVGELLCFKGRFRLKPHTITINGIEVPAPFKPKKCDELYYHIDSDIDCGFNTKRYDLDDDSHKDWMQFGAWRSEEEIRQVVAALREVFK